MNNWPRCHCTHCVPEAPEGYFITTWWGQTASAGGTCVVWKRHAVETRRTAPVLKKPVFLSVWGRCRPQTLLRVHVEQHLLPLFLSLLFLFLFFFLIPNWIMLLRGGCAVRALVCAHVRVLGEGIALLFCIWSISGPCFMWLISPQGWTASTEALTWRDGRRKGWAGGAGGVLSLVEGWANEQYFIRVLLSQIFFFLWLFDLELQLIISAINLFIGCHQMICFSSGFPFYIAFCAFCFSL